MLEVVVCASGWVASPIKCLDERYWKRVGRRQGLWSCSNRKLLLVIDHKLIRFPHPGVRISGGESLQGMMHSWRKELLEGMPQEESRFLAAMEEHIWSITSDGRCSPNFVMQVNEQDCSSFSERPKVSSRRVFELCIVVQHAEVGKEGSHLDGSRHVQRTPYVEGVGLQRSRIPQGKLGFCMLEPSFWGFESECGKLDGHSGNSRSRGASHCRRGLSFDGHRSQSASNPGAFEGCRRRGHHAM